MDIDRAALMRTFLAEAEEQLAGMEEGLAILSARPEAQEALTNVFLLAHTLKGSAATVGLDDLTELARALKDAVDTRHRRIRVDPELGTLLGQTVTAIRVALPSETGAPRGADHAELIARLAAFASQDDDDERGVSGNALADESLRALK